MLTAYTYNRAIFVKNIYRFPLYSKLERYPLSLDV